MSAHSVNDRPLLFITSEDVTELVDQQPGARRSGEWVHHVISLLDSAIGQLHERESAAQFAVLQAASLLKRKIAGKTTAASANERGRLLAWQARKVCEHIDRNIANRLLVADLCSLVQLSVAHFARAFRLTFGESPHAFVVRRRLELASRYMVQTEMSLSEIALQCGFADQAHLCRRFRGAIGQSPAAWRRASRFREASARVPESARPSDS
jgi:AraC family transcriptional regulator